MARLCDGRIAQRPFGGTAVPRTCYAADRTGHHLLQTLYAQVRRHDIDVFEEFVVLSLVQADGRVHGVVGIDLAAGSIVEFAARSVLFATGGYGRVFRDSTNASINTGGGIAYRAGVPIKDLEFVQFHPTTLFGTNILITEGARGEGGHLKNAAGERILVLESLIHVLRSDEKDSAEPAFVSFAVPHENDVTLLAALLRIPYQYFADDRWIHSGPSCLLCEKTRHAPPDRTAGQACAALS